MFNVFDGFMFSFAPFIVSIIFIIVFSMFFMAIVKDIKQWNYNNAQPILSVEAKIVGKRQSTSRHNHNNHHTSSTSHYATFEVENDIGKLKFQGTRYLGFERNRNA